MELLKIEVSRKEAQPDADVGAVALGFFQGESPKGKWEPPHFSGKRSADTEKLLGRLKDSKHFGGKKSETEVLRFVNHGRIPTTIIVGLGPQSKYTLEGLRRAAANVFQAQKKARIEKLAVQFDSFWAPGGAFDEAQALQAFAEGYWLASYQYTEMKEPEKEKIDPKHLTIFGLASKESAAALSRARSLSQAVCFARELGDKPSNVLTPRELARLVEQMSKARKIHCTILNRSEIEKHKMGLLMGVAKGSNEDPRFIALEYRGGKKGQAPIALVGKGVTFDSGGISIKPAASMEEMKYDMMGAATVAGIFQAVADLKLPINLNGYIPAVENMPGGKAQKPGDVVRSSRGKTVEITNTDAEGRLILADALEYAQKANPQAIFDFATLTGAVLIALGHCATGIMGNSPALIQRLKDASEETGERVWELPLFEEYEEDLKSAYADCRNSGNREAGSSKGGTFLKFFVDPKVPWVHCDIAGTAWFRKDVNYHPAKNASGAMIRLMVFLLDRWGHSVLSAKE